MMRNISLSLSAFVLAALAVVQPAGARPLVAPTQGTEYCRYGDGNCEEEEDTVKLCFQVKFSTCRHPRQACQDTCEQSLADGCEAALDDLAARSACKADLEARCEETCGGSLDLTAEAGAYNKESSKVCLMIDEWLCFNVPR